MCPSAHVSSDNTADWIRMPFGVVSEIGLSMGVLNFGGDRRRKGAVWGRVNLWRPIVTNGEFVASLCGIAYSNRAVVWRGEWGGPRHSCVRWKSTCLKWKGLFLAWFLAFFGICARIRLDGWNDAEKCIRLVCEKLAVFPYARYIVEICVELAFLWYHHHIYFQRTTHYHTRKARSTWLTDWPPVKLINAWKKQYHRGNNVQRHKNKTTMQVQNSATQPQYITS